MVKIITVCGFCGEHDNDESTIEINFRDSTLYFVCPKCKKTNTLILKPPPKSLPRISRMQK